MKKKYKMTAILPESRKCKRMRARYNMLQAGMEKINKSDKGMVGSKFSENWRRYVGEVK